MSEQAFATGRKQSAGPIRNPLGGVGVLGLEQAGGMVRGEVDREAAQAGIVCAARCGGESEAGAGLDGAAGAGGALLGLGLDAGLPAGAYRVGQALREVGTGVLELIFDVPLDGALGDTENVSGGAGARRNVVERCFNRLKQWRGIATATSEGWTAGPP